jgi:hypothetical protein
MENLKRLRGAVATVELTADLPGEYFVVVNQAGRRGASGFTVEVKCTGRCELKATKYPIVLQHGFSGFNSLGPLEYFYKVSDTFRAEGYDIYVSVVDPFNDSYKRGAQLAANVDKILEQTYAYKVNIIGHSQGGLDSRFMISPQGLGYGEKVGVLNTLATPHWGTGIADLALKSPALKTAFKVMFAAVGIVIEGPDMEHKLDESLNFISMENMVKFNAKYLDDPRVKYRSWTGKSCKLLDSGCPNAIDFFLIPVYNAIYDCCGPNDGMVQTSSAQWGDFLGYLNADHFQEVGQIAGMTGSFDHLSYYRSVMELMVTTGY